MAIPLIDDVDRRTFFKLGAAASIGTMALSTEACKKDISPYVSSVIGSLKELLPLLPKQAQVINKGISIAEDFDAAWRAGKFDNATTLFENLSDVVAQIAASAGVESSSVKVAVAVAGVALRAIAVFMKDSTKEPAIAAAVKARTGVSAAARVSLIDRLADENAVNAVFAAARP